MYDLGDAFEDCSVAVGSNLLITGPAMTGKRDLAYRMLATGSSNGEGAIVVTTKDSADRIHDRFLELTGVEDPLLGIIDCVTRQQGTETPLEGELIRYASSPVDLTGIGIELSELLQEFQQGRGTTETRVLLHSLSTLLMYSNLQTVFRFLHVFTGRIQSADALGLFVIDSTAHDQQTMSTLKQLFDGEIQVREQDGTRQARVVGIDPETDWIDQP